MKRVVLWLISLHRPLMRFITQNTVFVICLCCGDQLVLYKSYIKQTQNMAISCFNWSWDTKNKIQKSSSCSNNLCSRHRPVKRGRLKTSLTITAPGRRRTVRKPGGLGGRTNAWAQMRALHRLTKPSSSANAAMKANGTKTRGANNS